MRYLFTILFFMPLVCGAQLVSFFVRGDTLFSYDPGNGTERQLTRFIPTVSGQSGKYLSNNGSTFNWNDLAASVALKVNISDTANQMSPYAKIAAMTTLLSGKQATGSYVVTTNNLSDLSNVTTARSNLGLVIGTNVLAPAGSAASLTSFPTLNQNTTGTSSNVTSPISFTNGGNTGSAATSATTGTISVSMTTSIITCTPSGNMTLNATGGVAGQIVTFSITTSGTTSFTLTFGTNFRKTGTLATGTVSARFFTVTFRCLDGTTWTEVSRTAVQT